MSTFPHTTRILLVEDAAAQLATLKSALKTLGYSDHVVTAQNGEEALKALKAAADAKHPMELVIADWVMPGLDGFELLQRVRASDDYKTVPFVLLTSKADTSEVIEAAKAGVTNYIVKPVDSKLLSEKLEKTWKKIHPSSEPK